MQDRSSSAPRSGNPVTPPVPVSAPSAEGIEVVELPDRQQRQLDALRMHINALLADQWLIADRTPLTLRRGQQVCYVLHGMLISEGLA